MEHTWVNPQELIVDFEESPENDWLNLGNAHVNDMEDVEVFDLSHAASTDRRFDGTSADTSVQNDLSPMICYGAVCGVQLRLRKRQTMSLATLLENGDVIVDSGFAILQCRLNNHSCALVSKAGHAVADTSKKTFQALTICSRPFLLQHEAVIPMETMQEMIKCTDHESTFTADVNISGPPNEANRAAADLCHEGFFLQDPLWLPAAYTYRNPQLLDFPALSPDECSAPLIAGAESSDQLRAAENVLEKDLVTDFNQILDEFSQHDYLNGDVEVPQICTDLLDHQKEGLKFIVQKESNDSTRSRDLWVSSETVDGQNCFRHIITGAQSPVSSYTAGGLVADDMGLGKTLTMLTAIVRSRENAFEYARLKFLPGRMPIAAKSTLVVVPSALLMDSWAEEIKKHIVTGSVCYYKYHGLGKKIEYPQLLQNDVVLTTYGTLVTAYNRKNSLLHRIAWYRIVLDEAHTVRNCSTKQFEAVQNLHSLYRWCLTGTPIQNSLEDLGALVRFLRVPVLENPNQFRQHIINRTHLIGTRQEKDFANLKALLGTMCLRRNRSLLCIAEPNLRVYRLGFSTDEEARYTKILETCHLALDLAVSGHKGKEAHQSVLKTILQLRLFCNNGTLFRADVHSTTGLPTDPEEALSLLESTGPVVCDQCGSEVNSLRAPDDPVSAFLTACRHVICSGCFQLDEHANDHSCMMCHKKHSSDPATTSFDTSKQFHPERTYPTKLLALCKDIQDNRVDDKSVVFSFWKKSLDIVSYLLHSRGINVVRIDGSVSLNQRTTILEKFQQSPGGIVLLMTLGTGSEGLNNLSTADSVHILEPQWNPSVEKQAIGRVVRLGQTKKVTIVHYIMNKTVEEMIQSCQVQKLGLAHGGFNNRSSKEAMENAAEIRRLIFIGHGTG